MNDIQKIMGPFYRPLSEIRRIEVIPTGIILLDNEIFGVGGLPRGQGIEISGETHSGKSTLCLNIVKAVQKQGGTVLWYSTGEALDKEYAKQIGVDIEKMVVPPYSNADNMFQQIKLWLAYDIFDLIVIDSLAAIRTAKSQENETSVDDMADYMDKVKLISTFVNNLTGGYKIKDLDGKNIVASNVTLPIIKDGKTSIENNIHYLEQKKACLIFINREHRQVGMVYGAKTRSSGGVDKDCLITIRIILTADSGEKHIENGKRVLEYRTVKLVNKKNKAGGEPFREGVLRMYPNGSITEIGEDEPKKRGRKKQSINPIGDVTDETD
jgi:RecA/RadA recombinase